MIGLIVAVGLLPALLFPLDDPQPVESLAAALAPRPLVEMFAKEITIMLAIVYYAAAQAYVFHRLKPQEIVSGEAAQTAA